MERIYFDINEKMAGYARSMWSFSEYRPGSTTEEYKSYVNEAYNLADEVAAKDEKAGVRAYAVAERYSKRMAEYFNRDISINLMCPSVMICGPANFPVKKKNRQIAAFDSNMEFFNETQKLLDKIKSISNGTEVIKSSDEDCIERLEYKLETLKTLQEKMKAVNAALRKKDIEDGNLDLMELGYTEDDIKEIRTPDIIGRIGYPAYRLQNNNQEIHRIEERINSLKTVKERGTTEEENEGYTYKEDTELMRIQFIFDDKPDEETRKILKQYGFRWAPSQGAWQRQLTTNGQRSAKFVKKALSSLNAGR